MKRTFKLLSIVLLVAAVLAACNRPPTTGGGTPEVTINSPERDPDTNELVVSGTVTSDVTINDINYELTRTSDDSEVANGSITLGEGGAFEVRLAENALTDGEEYELTVTVDYEGTDQPVTESVTFTYEAPAPEELELTVDAPQDGSEVFTDTVTVEGSVANADGDVALSYNLNGSGDQDVSSSLTDGSFSFEVSGLTEGTNTLVVSASDGTNSDSVTLNLTYTIPTELTLVVDQPQDGDTLTEADVTVSGSVVGASGAVTLTYNLNDAGAQTADVGGDGSFSFNVTLAEGDNTLVLNAEDEGGNTDSETLNLTYTAPAPLELTVDSPTDNETVNSDTVTVSGSVVNAVGPVVLSYNLNGGGATDVSGSVAGDGSFSFEVSGLTEGANTLVVSASDGTNSDEVTLNLTYSVLPTTEVTFNIEQNAGDAANRSTNDALEFQDFVNASYPAGSTWTANTTTSLMYQDYGADEYGPISAAGLRFVNVTIPQGATIVSARLEFTALATRADTVDLTIVGEASDNAAAFVDQEVNNITGRTTTTTNASWQASNWTSGSDYATSDLSAVVQEIVDRGGWVDGNAMVLIIAGTPDSTNFQTAHSYRSAAEAGNTSLAPRLIVNYQAP